MNEETSDVSFKVGDEVIYAHRLIIRNCAPTLAELCEDTLEVELTEVTPWILKQIMRYIYGGIVLWPTIKEVEQKNPCLVKSFQSIHHLYAQGQG